MADYYEGQRRRDEVGGEEKESAVTYSQLRKAPKRVLGSGEGLASALERFDSNNERLDSLVGNLYGRLGPLLLPADSSSVSPTVVPDGVSDIATRLHNQNISLESNIRALAELIDRIDL